MSAKKKRQHYVPRFLLKNFSADKRRIALEVLATGRRVDDAQLKAQCYRDYFYGKDEVLENAFAKLEETSQGCSEILPPYGSRLSTITLRTRYDNFFISRTNALPQLRRPSTTWAPPWRRR